jgi:hypothetical protein
MSLVSIWSSASASQIFVAFDGFRDGLNPGQDTRPRNRHERHVSLDRKPAQGVAQMGVASNTDHDGRHSPRPLEPFDAATGSRNRGRREASGDGFDLVPNKSRPTPNWNCASFPWPLPGCASNSNHGLVASASPPVHVSSVIAFPHMEGRRLPSEIAGGGPKASGAPSQPLSYEVHAYRLHSILNQRGKAMIHSLRRNRKPKAFAEVLAMIADTQPELAPQRSVRGTNEWLSESATELCAALDRYAGRALQMKSSRPMANRARA